MKHLCWLLGIYPFDLPALNPLDLQPGKFSQPHLSPLGVSAVSITVLAILWLALFFGCAQIVQPTGGPEDLRPPQLDSLHSTPNFQTHFKKQDIVLAFDEWVELKDVFTQVVISPPLEFRPAISRKKKTIVLKFDEKEVLRDSATYVINYGEAIRDITKGNVAPMVFVFSTGSYIDSLSVSGNIVDAYTGKPVENVLFMLYENLADSVVRKDRPFYFAKTDKTGNFKVNNVKSGTFKAFALLDKNLNYRYDGEAEQIGFPDSMLVLQTVKTASNAVGPDSLATDSTALPPQFPDSLLLDSTNGNPPPQTPGKEVADSLEGQPSPPDTLFLDSLKLDTAAKGKTPPAPPIKIRLFQELKRLYLRDKATGAYGRVNLGFSREPFDAAVTFDNVGQTVVLEQEKDSIWVWYQTPTDTAWNIYVKRDTSVDTVLVKSGLRAGFLSSARLVAAEKAPPKPPVQQPFSPYPIVFSHPLESYNIENIQLLEDTAKVLVRPTASVDTSLDRRLQVDFAWKQGKPYTLQLLPGSVTDIFGLTNTDTITRSFTVGQEKDFGTLTLKVTGLNAATSYIIRILNKSEALYQQYRVDGVADFQETIPYMRPDTYSVELIEDLDSNGRWTTGNYDLRRQPERIQRKELEELRANWEVEATVEARFE
ncbi:MAG: Ig-like domain-containing protein [Saprospiraceae bacterium]